MEDFLLCYFGFLSLLDEYRAWGLVLFFWIIFVLFSGFLFSLVYIFL